VKVADDAMPMHPIIARDTRNMHNNCNGIVGQGSLDLAAQVNGELNLPGV
jgi:hypothetical protein